MARFLVVLDVDSTLIEDEVIELIAARAGVRAEVAAVTERAMRGELDFAESLRARVATLRGLPVDVLDGVRAEVRLTRGVPELVAGVHAGGGLISVVSGGFHEVLDPLATRLGLDDWRANRLAVADGRLTGEVDGPIVDARAKAEAMLEWADAEGVPPSRTVAIGDGANDLIMMERAGLSIAFDAKPKVRAAADLALDTRDLAAVLGVLGLR
ncbi:MAG: phosphoserine phosphatase SerB [Microbacteriaceae bacterium]|nr:phosphoserine phosphatase SerB [Microbacteriaceae bacterium]